MENNLPKLLGAKEVCELLGVSRTSIWNRLNPEGKYYDEHFPKPIKLGRKRIVWDSRDIQNWIDDLKKQSA